MWFSDNYSILCADVSLVKYECLSLFPIAYWKYVTCWFFFLILLAITERKILPKYTDEAIFINVEPYYSFGIIENGRICFSFCKFMNIWGQEQNVSVLVIGQWSPWNVQVLETWSKMWWYYGLITPLTGGLMNYKKWNTKSYIFSF